MNNSKIGNYAKVRRGASPRPISDPKYFGGNTGWVRIVDVTASKKYLKKTDQYVSKLGESLSVKVDKGDLIMSICGTIGRPIIIDIPACIHDGFVLFYDLTGVDAEYLYYTLQFNEKALENKGQPGTQVNLNTSIVSNHEVFVPPLPIQRKIARILSTIDGQIEKTEAIIAKYQAIKQGMLQDLFTRGIDVSTGQLRPRYEDAPDLYKESALGMIPTEWEVVTLDDTIKILDCKHVTPAYVPEGIPLLRPRNIKKEGLDLNDVVYVSEADYQFLMERHELKNEDILFTRNASFGVSSLLKGNVRYAIGQDVVILTEKTTEVAKFYIFQLLNSNVILKQIQRQSGGSTFGRINLNDFRKFLVPRPYIEEQNKIRQVIEATDVIFINNTMSLSKLQLLKQGLMQDLLSGKVAVTV